MIITSNIFLYDTLTTVSSLMVFNHEQQGVAALLMKDTAI